MAFLPVLLTRPEAHVANVSSMGGFFPFPGQTIYGASKAAVKLLTEGLCAELVDTDVRVTVIFPGAVETAITMNSGVDGPDLGADAGIEKDKLHVYVGPDSKLMNLASKVAPRPAIRFVQQRAKREVGKGALPPS